MASKVSYNLSSVPGFDNYIKTGDIEPEYDKYYSVNKYSTKANEQYNIVRYNKELLSNELFSTYGLLRSVIVSGPKIVCFAPPKSMSGESFINKYPVKNNKIIAETFVEGTMINVFYDPTYGATGARSRPPAPRGPARDVRRRAVGASDPAPRSGPPAGLPAP